MHDSDSCRPAPGNCGAGLAVSAKDIPCHAARCRYRVARHRCPDAGLPHLYCRVPPL